MNKMRSIIAALAACVALGVTANAVSDEGALNPRFIKWRKMKAAGMLVGGEGDGAVGIAPNVASLGYLADMIVGKADKPVDGYPAKFDLREAGNVTPARNQGDFNTCWAFASLASLESSILVQRPEDATYTAADIDFSEKHIVDNHGYDTTPQYGGSMLMAMAYLLRWAGPVSEATSPYPAPDAKEWVRSEATAAPRLHVQQVRWLPGKLEATQNDEIKKHLMKDGGVYATFYMNKTLYYNPEKSAYYCPAMIGDNHGVTIIGWDDNYPRENFGWTLAGRPPANGAYLVKNNWGEEFGDGGCFWVSYYDRQFAFSPMAVFCGNESKANYATIYQYDELGYTGQSHSGNSRNGKAWMANIFTATNDDQIAAVGFYALAPKTEYRIRIYTECEEGGNPSTGTLRDSNTQVGKLDYAGYFTIPLDKIVPVKAGTRFAVCVELLSPGLTRHLAYEAPVAGYSSKATATAGQSWYSANGTRWYDLADKASSVKGANFCVKAYGLADEDEWEHKDKVLPKELKVEGPSTVPAGSTGTFEATIVFDDNSTWSDVYAEYEIISGSEAVAADDSMGNAVSITVKNDLAEDTRVVLRITAEDDISGLAVTKDVAFTATRSIPAIPTGLTATGGDGAVETGVRLKWDEVANAESYSIYRSETDDPRNATFVASVQNTRYTDIDAVQGTDYTYYVKAVNGAGASGFSEGAQGWRKLAPPSGLIATNGDYDFVQLSWQASEGAHYYKVFRATELDADGNPVNPVEVSDWMAQCAFQDTPPLKGTNYLYWVKSAISFTGYRPSEYSIFDIGSRKAPVTLTSVQIEGPATVSAGSTTEYTLAATLSNGARVEAVSNVVWTCSLNGEQVVADKFPFIALVDYSLVASNTLVTLTASWTYASEDGDIAKSDSKMVVIAPIVPAKPEAVKVVEATVDGVRIEWMGVEGASGYNLYRGETAESATLLVSTACFEYLDSKVMPGATYYYWVEAVNAAGASERSDASASAMRQFTSPSYVTASNGTSTENVQVSWRAVNGANFYRVSRADTQEGEKHDLSGWISARTFSDLAAEPGRTYWYFVEAAYDAQGGSASAYSAATIGKVSPAQTLAFIEIDGPEFIQYDSQGSFLCVATYANGVQKRVKPVWSFKSAHELVNVDANGVVTAGHVTGEDLHLELQASYTDNGITKTDSFAITIIAAKAEVSEQVFVSNVVVRARWPWNGIIDISYDLYTVPATLRAVVSVSGYDHDLNRTLDAITLSGDGADYPAAGGYPHKDCRVTWNLGADYTNFHASAFSVSLAAAPYEVLPPADFRASDDTSTNAVELAWEKTFGAEYYEIFRSITNNRDNAQQIASVTNATEFSDISAEPGERYYYWIRTISGEFDTDISEDAGPVSGKRLKVYEKPSVDLQNGLVAYYPFDGNLDDASGNNHHLVFVTGDNPLSIEGNNDKAYRFADKTRLNATTNAPAVLKADFTFSAWVRTKSVGSLRAEQRTGLNTGFNALVCPALATERMSAAYGIAVDKNGINLFEHSENHLPAVLRYPVDLGEGWHFVAFTVAENKAPVLYVDGAYAKTGIDTGRSKELFVGELIGGGEYGMFKGDADDVCYYDRALSRDEISALYEAVSPLVEGRPVSVMPTIDVAYEGSVATVSITCVEEGAPAGEQPTIYYTIERFDGGNTVSAREYTGSFQIEGSARVIAWSAKEGYYNSPRAKVDVKADWKDNAHETLVPGDTDHEVDFNTSGDTDWVFDPNETSDNVNGAMRSGRIGADGVSSMSASVKGEGQFAFDWKVSSEAGFDCLEVKVDGETAHKISGSVDWTELVLEFTNDVTHVITWTYSKDSSVDRGSDCGWVDHITWAPLGSAVDSPIITARLFVDGASNRVEAACANLADVAIEVRVDLFGETGKWTPYTGPFVVEGEAVVYARARKAGYIDSFTSKLEVKRSWVVRVTEALVTDEVTRGAVMFVPDYYEYGVDEQFWWNQDREVVSDDSCASVRSPEIADAELGDVMGNGSSIFAKFSGKGTLFFDWKVDSEAGWDVLTYYAGELYDDYSYADSVSGDKDWARIKIDFASDYLHVMEWEYNKDDRGKSGRDCGWVDALRWMPARFAPDTPALRPGYVFNGWATNENGEVVYEAGFRLDAEDENETFIAVYSPISYKVVYAAQPADEDLETEETLVYDEPYTLLAADNFVFTRGYLFNGWSTNEQNTVDFADGATVVNLAAEQDAVVMMRPVLNPIHYSVSFHEPDGSQAASTISAAFDEDIVLPAPNAREGYRFDGWATSPNGEVRYVAGERVRNLVVADGENAALYARWVLVADPFAVALDVEDVRFTTDGNAQWFVQSAVVKQGAMALQSGAIGHNQNSKVSATVELETRTLLTFWWKVSSEANYDYLRFYVNGSMKGSISGTDDDWLLFSVELPAGVNTLEWNYTKDGSVDSGSDCGWVDSFVLEPITAPEPENTALFTLIQYPLNRCPYTLDDAIYGMATPSYWSMNPITNTYTQINFRDNMRQSQSFAETAVEFPATAATGRKPEYFACCVTGEVEISSAGEWTFACGSDDGFRCVLTDEDGREYSFEFLDIRAYDITMTTFNFAKAGRYQLRLEYFEWGDQSSLDLSCARGRVSRFNTTDFKLIGTAASGIKLVGANN